MSKSYNIPETIYCLYLMGSNHLYKSKVNRTFLIKPDDIVYDPSCVVAVPFELNFIADEVVDNKLADTKRLYLIYDEINSMPYVDLKMGKVLVAFTTHKRATAYKKHKSVNICPLRVITCGYRERDRKCMIDDILKDLEQQEKETN